MVVTTDEVVVTTDEVVLTEEPSTEPGKTELFELFNTYTDIGLQPIIFFITSIP